MDKKSTFMYFVDSFGFDLMGKKDGTENEWVNLRIKIPENTMLYTVENFLAFFYSVVDELELKAKPRRNQAS